MLTSSSHYTRLVCFCDVAIAQCRCPGLKEDRIVERGCTRCKDLPTAEFHTLPPTTVAVTPRTAHYWWPVR